MSDEYITIDDAAKEKEKSRATMWVWIRRHDLPTYRFTGQRKTFIRREDMERFSEPVKRETHKNRHPDESEWRRDA